MENTKIDISLIGDLLDKDIFDVYIPSLKKNLGFKSLSILQQKELFKNTVTQSPIKLNLIESFNKIISNNCVEKIDLGNINYIDKIAIIFKLRIESFGEVFNHPDESINLSDRLKFIYDIGSDYFSQKTVKINDKISFDVSSPSVYEDYKMSQYMNEKLLNAKDAGLIVSELYISEIVKYIDNMSTPDIKYNFRELTIGQRFEIINMLSSFHFDKISKVVEKYKNIEKDVLSTSKGNFIEMDGQLFFGS